MESFVVQSSALTPFVKMDAGSGCMVIKGRSIPDQPDEFWLPILSWFESYMEINPEKIHFSIDLEYFNISSSKRILFLLYKLNELAENGTDVSVEWRYRLNDEDMFEVGQDYAYMVKVPFEFCGYEENEMVLIA